MTVQDRQRGCLLGLAVGDALGAAVEFKSPGSFAPVTDYRAGGPHELEAGEWTDDTSLALALADSIQHVAWDLNDQARRYVSWWKNGTYSVNDRCFDIGITTRSALAKFEKTGDARLSASRSPQASGNGSIMRLAPVPIYFAKYFPAQVEQLANLAAESSLPTHASPQCLSACRYFALVLAGLINGLERDVVLAPDWEPLAQLSQIKPLHPEVEAVARGSFREKQPPEISGSGYVVKSLEADLWAFHDAKDFHDAVLKAVNLGDDADTTGAVCGQLAGAYWGESGIPEDLLEGLARRDMLEQALAGLLGEPHRLAGNGSTPPTSRCYWVVENKLLAGAYPGSVDPAEHHEKTAALWHAGIRTFINLMEEHETNSDGVTFAPYEDVLAELAAVHDERVTKLRFPVRDLSITTVEVMHSILDAIDQSLAAGRPVYLHCFGGVGRTGTAVACWLLRHGLAQPDNVLQIMHQLRQADHQRKHRPAPENDEQIQFAENWQEGR